MREILFRGKMVDNGEWWFGSLITPMNLNKLYCIHNDIELPFYRGVTSETIGQYTGLTDKNGKKIFEGDILKIMTTVKGDWIDENGNYKEPKRIDYAVVQEDKNTGGYKLKVYHNGKYKRIAKFTLTHIYCYYKAEVIGNIHDNPELLEEVEK